MVAKIIREIASPQMWIAGKSTTALYKKLSRSVWTCQVRRLVYPLTDIRSFEYMGSVVVPVIHINESLGKDKNLFVVANTSVIFNEIRSKPVTTRLIHEAIWLLKE